MSTNYKFSTIAVQGTYKADETGARVLPIHQTASFDLGNTEKASNLFALKEFGNIYSRINNPTCSAFEEKVALLEGGVAALSTSSGQAALSIAILNICGAGDHILASSSIYGGSYTLFKYTFGKLGIEVTFFDQEAPFDEIQALVKPNTKVVYGETIGNPGLNILDFEKFAKVSEQNKIPFIVDNTFATPYLARPFEFGAHIVIHSATKYIGGHGNSIGGVIVDSGKFDWDNGKFTDLIDPDPSYHGIKYVESFGPLSYIVKARVQVLRDVGATLSPFNSFLLNLGLETLPIRMEKHCENTLKLAKYLESNENVSWVNYPGLDTHKTYDRKEKYLPKGASGVFTFGIKGGKEAGIKFIDSVKLASLVANIGDTRTMVIHPASTTHSQLSEEEQNSSGVTSDLIRVSVGIEDIEDIIEDFKNALA